MRIKSFVLGGAALLSVVVGLSAPALAYTHHPSTAAERKQTNDLNSQALAQAQGQPMQQQAANTAMPNASTAMPEQQNNAMTTTSPSATAPADQQNQNQQGSTKPSQPSDQNTQTPQAQTPQPSPQQ